MASKDPVRAAVVREARRIVRAGGDPRAEKYHMRLVRAAMRAATVAEREGCVQLRKCRATGTMVGVYRAAEAGMETDPETPWCAVCEEHHTLVCTATRKQAETAASYPDFCEDCQPKLR